MTLAAVLIDEAADRIDALEARIVGLESLLADQHRHIESLEDALRQVRDRSGSLETASTIANRALEGKP